ncbi:MAG: Fe2+-dependent dioxygenase [Sphingomonas sp. SCN 67-18]|uniref:Fe2+-dependent dioxygenase n=1 Tax=uncultured Sphingomonas sp. TaxID=158754 RepID=UPI00086E238D|nr:Fe2+-dependent dioxygenase [Sphingomonas sp. SCN 67-18]ODU22596.1 MAG: Fe2+-dependent dioxygenase [Sphingomonas sp. SCN 67-18]
MLIEIPAIFSPEETAGIRARLEQAGWRDGAGTAGHVAARAKTNLQLADNDPLGAEIGAEIVARLAATPRFVASAVPLRILPPRFNLYAGGGAYGRHIDSAVFSAPGTRERVRSDLSATLFLSDPESYDGGELVAEFGVGRQQVKLPAGHLLLYPANSLHQVMPVVRGARLAAFFWIQSLVRSHARRALLLELDDSIQTLAARDMADPEVVRLTGLYHNLLREWAET